MLDLTPVRVQVKGRLYPFVLDAGDIPNAWDSIQPFIERSVRVSEGTISVKAIRSLLGDNQAICFGTARDSEPEFVITAHVVDYSHYRAARILSAAGKNVKEAMEYFYIVETWAHSLGATELEAWCRPAMVRLLQPFGFTSRFTILTKTLVRNLQ